MTTTATVAGETLSVPNSSGTAPPQIPLPVGATDCHHHIMDPRFPRPDGSAIQTIGTIEDYRLFRRRLGLSRSVVIAASGWGADNTTLLDALDSFGETSRGVAIITPQTTDAELDALHARRVRGIRLYLGTYIPPTLDEMVTYSRRIARLGWHIQLVAARHAPLLGPIESTLMSLACPLVIDHMGYVPQPNALNHPEAEVVRRLLDNGRTWVKLSGVYIRSLQGYPDYADVNELAADYARRAPERMLWGTDWPHTGAGTTKPDGAKLADQVAQWAPDPAVRHRIFVENPEKLYWYA